MEKIVEAILVICAASSAEELDESVMERFEHYAEHPVEINCSTKAKLMETGLFSAFQAASLLDYRSRCGDILSAAELGAVDGFTPALAGALRPFVSFTSRRAPGEATRDGPRTSADLTIRGSTRSDKTTAPFGVKAGVNFTDRLEINWASRTTYSDPDFEAGTMNATFYGRRRLGKLVIGDFNARFGQGLMVWNGFTLSTHTTASSILRSAGGISASRSFSEARHGIAADFDFGRWTLSTSFDRKGEAIANASYVGKSFSGGVTLKSQPGDFGASADWKAGFQGGAAFGEIAFDKALKALAGAFWVPRYGSKLAARLLWSPDEHSAATAFSCPLADISAETVGRIEKGTGNARATGIIHPSFALGQVKLEPRLRVSTKYSWGSSPLLRTDIRAECGAETGCWSLKGRFDAVFGRDFAWLWYAEAGYGGTLSAFLRGGLFKVDNWDDRIYVYERDAPGAFNVPSYYGRGVSVSAVAGWKTKKRALHFRASSVWYPGSSKKSVCEIKLQYSRHFRRVSRSSARSHSQEVEDAPRSHRQTR